MVTMEGARCGFAYENITSVPLLRLNLRKNLSKSLGCRSRYIENIRREGEDRQHVTNRIMGVLFSMHYNMANNESEQGK